MPHSAPDFSHRAQLTELMDEPCTRDQLRGCLSDLAKLNRWTFAYRPVIHWLDTLVDNAPSDFMQSLRAQAEPLRILDVASGYGDGLRRIEQWANSRRIAVELTGLDINPDAIVIAGETSPAVSRIRWITADIFHYSPPQPVHLVVSSLFTHHLSEKEIVRFLQWMEQHAKLGWFVNDLSRAQIPYHFMRIFGRLARLHPFVQHDAPASIARSFVPEDWQRMCASAGLSDAEVEIQSFKPARLCVGRRKPLRQSVYA
jgi:SAM-dependent methyltransferase